MGTVSNDELTFEIFLQILIDNLPEHAIVQSTPKEWFEILSKGTNSIKKNDFIDYLHLIGHSTKEFSEALNDYLEENERKQIEETGLIYFESIHFFLIKMNT